MVPRKFTDTVYYYLGLVNSDRLEPISLIKESIHEFLHGFPKLLIFIALFIMFLLRLEYFLSQFQKLPVCHLRLLFRLADRCRAVDVLLT